MLAVLRACRPTSVAGAACIPPCMRPVWCLDAFTCSIRIHERIDPIRYDTIWYDAPSVRAMSTPARLEACTFWLLAESDMWLLSAPSCCNVVRFSPPPDLYPHPPHATKGRCHHSYLFSVLAGRHSAAIHTTQCLSSCNCLHLHP